jgi:hypothetical protein
MIFRRDLLNNALLAAGAALLDMPAPAQRPSARDTFTGYGGVGDYATSNGDPWSVVTAGHRISQGAYAQLPADIPETGESFDLLVVGGGLSGLGSAYYFAKATGGKERCLILENHPMFGGHCKQNEFVVNGQHLIGPQASNDFGIPREGSRSQMDELFTELHLPREYIYASWDPFLKPLRFPRDNYSHMDGINDTQVLVSGKDPRIQPALLVRGSSRRIMPLRFRPENISVINRRASHWAVIGPAVQNLLKAHSGIMFPLRRPSKLSWVPERCSQSRVRFAAPTAARP